MRALHVASTLSGGAGTGLRRYHEALLSVGVDSRILVAAGGNAAERPRVATVRRRYARGWERLVRSAGLTRPPEVVFEKRIAEANATAPGANYELFSLPYSPYSVEEYAWIEEADVVCLHFVAGFVDGPRFFHRVTKPVVVFLHDQQPYLGGFHYERDRERNPQLKDLDDEVRAIKKTAMGSHCVGVVANSDWNAQAARRSGFFAESVPIERIYYPLDLGVFRPRPCESAKQAFGIEAGAKAIGFACENLDNRRKGFAELVAALELLPEDVRREVVLLSFGREPAPAIRDRVKIPWVHLGSLDSPAAQVAAYSAMDVFVVPSKAEAFGLTAQEALACGCRVVATRTGGLPEALGVFGTYAGADDPESISTAIESGLADGLHYESARRWMAETFLPERMGRDLGEFLREVRAHARQMSEVRSQRSDDGCQRSET